MKSHVSRSLLLIAVFLVSLESRAANGCNGLSLQTASSVSFSANAVQQIALSVKRNNTNHGCEYFVTFSRGIASNYNRYMAKGADSAPYQLYRGFPDSDILKDLSDAVSSSDVIAGSFLDNAGSTQNVETYRAVLGNVAYLPVGFYFDLVTVRLYEGTLSSYALRDTTNVTFQYSSTRSIDLSLVSTGAAFNASATSMTLDFGTMYTGETKAFDILVATNAGYSLSMSSWNGGAMKHASLRGTFVPYSMGVNGRSVTLGNGNTVVATGSGVTPSGGSRIPVNVMIGALLSSMSGAYGDSITVTVQTTE
jgi:hypothetical protein